MVSKTSSEQMTVLAIGSLPPPHNGQSKNLKQITDDIEAQPGVRLTRRSVSIGQLHSSLTGDIRKAGRQLLAWSTVVLLWRPMKPRTLYFVADGGRGLLYTSITATLGRLLGYKMVLQHRTFAYIYTRKPLMAYVNRMLGDTGKHVFLSPGMAQQYFDLYQPDRPFDINHNLAQTLGFWKELRRVPRRRPSENIRVGLLSNLMKVKGLDVFLDVARRAKAEDINATFVLAGPAFGPEEEQMIQDAQAELGASLEWLGSVQGAQKTAFYRGIDLFVFPTRYPFEAQPNVVLEAVCAGAYVIAPDRGCIKEDLATLGGICVDRKDETNVEAWFNALKSAISDPVALRSKRAEGLRLARTGIKTARANYNIFLAGFRLQSSQKDAKE